ncbi:transcriptional regulator, partial [Vibrio parahaemolyticus]
MLAIAVGKRILKVRKSKKLSQDRLAIL